MGETFPAKVYRVVSDKDDQLRVETAVIIRKSGGWRYFRDRDGAEWRENGPGLWRDSLELSLREFIVANSPINTPMQTLYAVVNRKYDPERYWRLMVQACCVLNDVWNNQRRNHDTEDSAS